MDTSRKWVALAVAAALVLAVGGWSLLVQPQRDEAAVLREQADVQLEQNAHLRTQLEVLRGKAAGLSAQQADIAEIADRIPAEIELPELVRALTAAARGAGVELAALTPGAPVPVAQDGAVTEQAADQPVGGLTALPLSMQVTGDFYELEQFVAALEDLPRAVRVTDVSLSDAGDTRGRVLTSTITASVYSSGGAAAAAAPAPEAGAAPAPAAEAPAAETGAAAAPPAAPTVTGPGAPRAPVAGGTAAAAGTAATDIPATDIPAADPTPPVSEERR